MKVLNYHENNMKQPYTIVSSHDEGVPGTDTLSSYEAPAILCRLA